MKQAIRKIHLRIGMLQDELDGIPFSQMGRIKNLEARISNLETTMNVLKHEQKYDEKGSCQECGALGDGKSNGFIHCKFHGVMIQA